MYFKQVARSSGAHLVWLLVASLAAVRAAPCAQVGAAPDSGDAALEQITVSAEKRQVDLQDAPIAITAVSAARLDQSNIAQMADLNALVPGLTIAKSSGFERIVTIRGIGSETPENAYVTQPGVSFHIDGVYIANTISLDQSLFDVDHIEVSRGPQATVFGQTSTGGTINLISRQPQLHTWSGSLDESVGSDNLYRSRGMLNIPLGDILALRASAQIYGHEGWTTDIDIPGFRLDQANDRSGKLALLWQPREDLSVTAMGQIYRTRTNGAAQRNVLDPNPDPRVVSQDYPGFFQLDTQLYALTAKWEMPWAQVKSVSSFQLLNHHQREDGSRLDEAFLGFFDHVEAWNTLLHDTTQEVSLVSHPGGVLDWVVGGFYLHQVSRQHVLETQGPPEFVAYANDADIDRISVAGYGQLTVHLARDLRFTAGGRYNHDHYSGPATSNGVTSSDVYSKAVPTGKVELQYDASDSSLEYLSFTRGYKPGGVNDNTGSVVVSQLFKPEHINAFEIGSKSRLADDNLIANAAAYYYDYQAMQFLAVDPNPYHYGVDNLPTSRIFGLELESAYLAMDRRFRLEGDLSLARGRLVGDFHTLDAREAAALITSIPACQSGAQFFNPACWQQMVAHSPGTDGNDVPKLPRVQGSLAAGYTAGLGRYALLARLEYLYRGPFQYRIFNDGVYDKVGGYGQWNLYFQLTPKDSRYSCGLAISNLTDVAGINSRYTDPYGTGQTSDELIPPRQIIATLGYQF
jgi:iron complex outermembrane receptor protein